MFIILSLGSNKITTEDAVGVGIAIDIQAEEEVQSDRQDIKQEIVVADIPRTLFVKTQVKEDPRREAELTQEQGKEEYLSRREN